MRETNIIRHNIKNHLIIDNLLVAICHE